MNQGTPSDAVGTLLASLTESKYKQYDTSFKKWWEFSQGYRFNPFKPTVSSLLSFLQSCLKSGVGYSTIGTHRSAISLISHRVGSIEKLGENPLISRFMKGVGKIRPPRPKYDITWDPAPVLSYLSSLEPVDDLNLHDLSLKLIGLLTLATGQRLQTLHAIKVSNIDDSNEDFIQIKIDVPIKTSRPGAVQPCLILPRFTNNSKCCVVRALKAYLYKTDTLREGNTSLFLSTGGKHHPVSKQTLSKWVKQVLQNSGIDLHLFSSHSTRHASTSAAKRLGIPLDSICSRAGWSSSSSTFAKFYDRPVDKRQAFANAVLLNTTYQSD